MRPDENPCRRKTPVKVMLFVFLLCVFIAKATCDLPVVISRGAIITPVRGVTVYNDLELIHHIISDLPDPPSSIAHVCPIGATERSCNLNKHLHRLVEDNAAVLSLLNKARTTYGLSDYDLPNASVPTTAFRTVPETHVRNEGPSEDIIKKVGQPWFEQVRRRLMDRKPSVNSSDNNSHKMTKRFVQHIPRLLMSGAALLGADDLVDFATSLFVGENGILKFLSTLQATSPEHSVVDLSRRVSEFEAEFRNIISDMALDANAVKTITEDLQHDVAKHKMDLATVEDSHIVGQQLLSDLATVLFTYGIYFSIMDADTNCRNGNLSPILLPPHLLADKLEESAIALPPDLKLAIGFDQIQTYYTTKSASCLYDSNGGLITVHVPIVYKSADYKLYEYRNLFFAWKDKTCTLEAASRYAIKDIKSNQVYPVEDLDEEKCSPHLTKRCKVPPASDSAEAYCLTQMLSSSTVAEVREACKMFCFDKKETIVSQVLPNVFVGVHVPPNSLSIDCPHHEIHNITDQVEYGSLRIVLTCGCTIRLGQKTVARSVGPKCQGHESIAVDILLPGHWTTLTDFLPFTNNGLDDVTKFQHAEEIFNEHYMDSKNEDNEFITTEISIVTVVWNFLHSLLLVYVMFRLNVVNTAGGLATLSGVRMVEAADNHFCRLEDDVYYMLYGICMLCSLAFVPPVICKFYSFISKQFNDAVDVATERRLVEGAL